MSKIDYDNLYEMEQALNLPKDSLKSIPIYARRPAADAISRVMQMERNSLFRPGLYYILLADLVGNTSFNEKYGNGYTDIRVQWFHTAAIQAIGEINLSNYVTFSKTIGDASLLIFSSIKDVISWSNKFSEKLVGLNQEYPETIHDADWNLPEIDDALKEQHILDFELKARKLVHAGEVRYSDINDPLSLAVSQTFKMEKAFAHEKLGCTEFVASTIHPALPELGYALEENRKITIAGEARESMTYYIVPK